MKTYFSLFISTLLLLLAVFNRSHQILAQLPSSQQAQVAAIMKMPDSKAKIDSILRFTSKNRKTAEVESLFALGFEVVKKYHYDDLLPKLLDAYGVYKRDFALYAEALNLHKQGLDLARQQHDTRTEIHALNNIGVVYRRLDENAKALIFHLDALKLAEKHGDDFSASVSLNSMGNIHIVNGNYAEAIAYFEKCLPIAEKAHNDLGIAMNLNNIGEAYEFMGELDSADKYYRESLEYNNKISNQKGIAISYNSLGNILKKQKQPRKAIQLFQKALLINQKLGDGFYSANNYNNLGKAYLMLGKVDSSKAMFFMALGISKSIGSISESKSSYEGLMRVNERIHNVDSAFAYSKLFKLYSDSINFESNNRHIRQMEAIYNSEKEQARIGQLETKRKNDRIFLFGTLILFLLILTSGALYYLRSRLLERNKRLHQELELRTQIASDLHDDMGSTLSSIHIFSELLRKAGTNKEDLLNKIEANAKDTLDALDDIIWLVKPSNDKFSNLCQHIREYAIPMFESMDICFKVDFPDSISETPLPMDTRRNIFLIIKESVNNLVKYANCTTASVTAIDEADEIRFEIRDNGMGFDPEKLTNRSGIQNIKARAKSIKAPLTIQSAPGLGTVIQFLVKKQSNGK